MLNVKKLDEIVAMLQHFLEHLTDALHRRPEFEVSVFKFPHECEHLIQEYRMHI
jgi:hypothetical protein